MKELEELVKVLEKYMDDAKWWLDNNWPDERERERSISYGKQQTEYQAYKHCYLIARQRLDQALQVIKPGD